MTTSVKEQIHAQISGALAGAKFPGKSRNFFIENF